MEKVFTLSSGKLIQGERHRPTEIPQFYPEKIVRLKNGTVGLISPHSEYFTPSPKNQQKLERITKKSKSWLYVNYLSKTR